MKKTLIPVIVLFFLVFCSILVIGPETGAEPESEVQTTAERRTHSLSPGNIPGTVEPGSFDADSEFNFVRDPTTRPGERLPYITNGNPAAVGDFPWMVLLESDGELRCSGTLIHKSFVLTAAHCLDRISEGSTAHIGVIGLGFGGGESIEIGERIPHSQPDVNDIALLRLKTPSTIQPLEAMTTDTEVLIIGFGQTELVINTGSLVSAEARIVSNSECAGIPNYQATLCAGDKESGICWGDSGGPMVTRDASGLIGVANDIHPNTQCGENVNGLRVGTFAPVSAYEAWINGVTASR